MRGSAAGGARTPHAHHHLLRWVHAARKALGLPCLEGREEAGEERLGRREW